MPTIYFALPVSDALAEGVRSLATQADRPARVARLRSLASLYVDAVVEGLVLGLAQETAAPGSTAAGLLRTLASITKSVSHGLIRGALSNPTDDEIERLEDYLRDYVRTLPGRARAEVVFAFAPDVHASLTPCFAASHARRATEDRGAYRDALIGFCDETLRHYYSEPVSRISLGRVFRATVDMGRAAISRASHAAARQSAENEGEAALAAITSVIETRFVLAPACAVVVTA